MGRSSGFVRFTFTFISSVLISIGKSLALPSIMINVPYTKYDCLLKMTRIASSKDSKDCKNLRKSCSNAGYFAGYFAAYNLVTLTLESFWSRRFYGGAI